jgi:hypothetical protein
MLAALVAMSVLAGCGSEEASRSSDSEEGVTGEGRSRATQSASRAGSTREVERTVETSAGETSERLRCSEEERTHAGREEIRIGDFEPPEKVPAYEIIEEKPVERDGAKATRLLVDTPVGSEEGYTLITRDIKSRYGELDAVGIEFTDSTGTLSYKGGAMIFNTPCGVDYIGYIWAPPNNEGYDMIAPKE